MNRALKVALALTLLAVVLAALFAAERVASRGRFASPYSTYGGGPDGTMALLRLTEQLGYEARPLARELSQLGAPSTLVAIGGCKGDLARDLARPEREELERWISRGGLLIVAGAPEYVPKAAGLSRDRPATCEDEGELSFFERAFGEELNQQQRSDDPRAPFRIIALPEGPPLAHLAPFFATRAHTVRAHAGTEAAVLVSSSSGALGLTAKLGRGRVVLLGIPDTLTNRELGRSGGALFARLLAAFAPKGPVWFDEYHLGMGERRSLIRYVRDLGHGAVLAQLVALVLVALFAGGTRLGEPRAEPSPRARSTRSYLKALGFLYVRTKDEQGALSVLSRRALAKVARHYRATHVPLEQLPEALSGQGLGAVAAYAARIRVRGGEALTRGESLHRRALEIDEDTRAAIALGDAP